MTDPLHGPVPSTGVRWSVRGFSVPKAGMREDENEDAVRWEIIHGWMAVADGATEASYSRDWARLIASAFGLCRLTREFPPSPGQVAWVLSRLQDRWHRMVPWRKLEELGWNRIEKARQGAFATFLGVRFDGTQWSAMGVGDCNLFVLSASGSLRLSTPAHSASEFGTSPLLVPSVPGPVVGKALASVWTARGTAEAGDWIVAATDAVAAYLLVSVAAAGAEKPAGKRRRHRQGPRPSSAICALLGVRTLEQFADWVGQARTAGMRNDDSTVAMARLTGQIGEAGQENMNALATA